MNIQIEKLIEFLSNLKRDTDRMNHINHYPHLEYLYHAALFALELAYISRSMLDHSEIFPGDVGENNLAELKKLLNQID